jgi:hypothetical protein
MADQDDKKERPSLQLVTESTQDAATLRRWLQGKPGPPELLVKKFELLIRLLEERAGEAAQLGDVRAAYTEWDALRESALLDAKMLRTDQRAGRLRNPKLSKKTAAATLRVMSLHKTIERAQALDEMATRLWGALAPQRSPTERRDDFVDRLMYYAGILALRPAGTTLESVTDDFIAAAKAQGPRQLVKDLDRDDVRRLARAAIEESARRGRPRMGSSPNKAGTARGALLEALGFRGTEDALRVSRARRAKK